MTTANDKIKGLAKALDELATYGRVSDESRELLDDLTGVEPPPEPEDETENETETEDGNKPENSGKPPARKPPARKSTSTGGK